MCTWWTGINVPEIIWLSRHLILNCQLADCTVWPLLILGTILFYLLLWHWSMWQTSSTHGCCGVPVGIVKKGRSQNLVSACRIIHTLHMFRKMRGASCVNIGMWLHQERTTLKDWPCIWHLTLCTLPYIRYHATVMLTSFTSFIWIWRDVVEDARGARYPVQITVHGVIVDPRCLREHSYK